MNISLSKTCCFSGHRDIQIDDTAVDLLLTEAIKQKLDEGYSHFIVGGALGFDMLAATVLSRIKRKEQSINLIFALPCPDHTKDWTRQDQMMLSALLSFADKVVTVSATYDNNCMYRRNRYMVDRSDALICYMERSSGGTAYTVKYAVNKGIETINLYHWGSA